MTKSTITREQLLEIIETDHVQCGEASYLARMALAAMASEHKRNPVLAYADSYRDMAKQGVESVPIWSIITELERNIAPIYRHAQQPVVPDAYVRDERGRMMLNGICEPKIGFGAGWNACRAAMLHAQSDDDGEPTDDERIMAIEGIHSCERCGDEGWVVGEMGITRCACGHAGNSPVIPDGWTGNDKANAALMMLDRIETVDPVDDDRIDGIKRIVRELAAAPHDTPALNSVQSVLTVLGKWIPVSEQNPDCWCLTCRPVTLNDMRFVVCPDCGNKRCPRANDHRNACTRSNEPGQEGSAYPAAPQEVRGE